MPKKMQRLDESWDFRPFKFRIQAFTNAFTEKIITAGISDDVMPTKMIKVRLQEYGRSPSVFSTDH